MQREIGSRQGQHVCGTTAATAGEAQRPAARVHRAAVGNGCERVKPDAAGPGRGCVHAFV
jgi:hypothetical protein